MFELIDRMIVELEVRFKNIEPFLVTSDADHAVNLESRICLAQCCAIYYFENTILF